MSDVVKRLREAGILPLHLRLLRLEAADEIERLDAAWSNCSRACARVQGERDAARAEIERLRALLPPEDAELPSWQELAQALKADNDKLRGEIERLRAQLHEVREIYANMEGFIPETAPEGYCLQTLKQMYNAAKEKRDE